MIPATKKQKQLIHVNAPTRDIKEEFVQWATGDVNKTSCNDLDFAQANQILKQLGCKPVPMDQGDLASTWGKFNNKNKEHRKILSLLRQIQWTTTSEKWGEVADIIRFGAWLRDDPKAPVKKPLLKMTPEEVSKTIIALQGILKWMYK